MNKKIEELAMESCLHGYMVHLYTVYAPDGYRVPLENRMISVEKFAEFIVKECIKICNHTGHDVSNGGKLIPLEFYDKAEDDLGEVAWLCADKIKEHFTIKT